MRRLQDLPAEVLQCILHQLIQSIGTPDGAFRYYEWEERVRQKKLASRPLGLRSSHDSGLGLNDISNYRMDQERRRARWKEFRTKGKEPDEDFTVEVDECEIDDLEEDTDIRPVGTSNILADKRYAHPLLAIRSTSTSMHAAVESFSNTCLLAIHRNANSVNNIEFRTDTPGIPRSVQLIEFLWTRCAFCHRGCDREGFFAWYLRVCEYCDDHYFPSISETDAVERYHISVELLRDHLRRRKIRAYRDSWDIFHYLEDSVARLAIQVHGQERIMREKQERDFQKQMERQGWLNTVRMGLKINGLKPDVFIGIEHDDIPLEQYDRKLHTPNFKGDSPDEFIRFQILVKAIKTRTKFHTEVIPLLDKLDHLLNGGSLNAEMRAPRLRTYHTPAFVNKVANDLRFETHYVAIDVMDVALFNLFIVEFNIRNINSPRRLLKAYLKCAEKWTMGFWKGDFHMRGGFTDGPWSIQRYPLRFTKTEASQDSVPPTPPVTQGVETISGELDSTGVYYTGTTNNEAATTVTTPQTVNERHAETMRYLSGSIDRLLDYRKFKPRPEKTLTYGKFPTS